MSITTPQGFSAAGITAGLKASGKSDLALVVNQGPRFDSAAVFTTNRVAAAPVQYSRQAMAEASTHAVVLNSGGANACTGKPGFQDSVATASQVAQMLDIQREEVLVCSTGLIGERLPMDKILAGVETASQNLSADGGADAAAAIMTTDTVEKTEVFTSETYSIGGMAKGAGMLAPGMATMLAIITTDAVVDSQTAQEVLNEAVRVSFNRADSDGCMSTNDTVILLSSGASETTADIEEFQAGVTQVCASLARQMVSDAEGSSHDIAVTAVNAASEADAESVCRTVARSNLFKTAVFGQDPNWGRVLSAVGTTDAVFEPEQLDVTFNGVQVCRGGGIGDSRDLVDLSARETHVEIDLHAGTASATIWTNDLTHEYVEENSAYSS